METQTATVKVGDGATLYGWSDRRAYTVTYVSDNGKIVKLQRDDATLLNGSTSGEPDALVVHPGGFCANVTGKQRWSLKRDPMGEVTKATLRENGKYGTVGSALSNIEIGVRNEFYDYNF